MSYKSVLGFLLCAFLVFTLPALSQKKTKAASATKPDACTLLTSAEITAVLGEEVKATKSSTQPGAGLVMTQCFFGMATSAKSVSLAFASANPAANPKLTPREFWRKQFPSPGQKDEKGENEAKSHAGKSASHFESEHEEDLSKPRAIAGIGEEAYWVGNAISGALYVLTGDTFLRVSVGGIRQEPERVEKSKSLARAAIKRL